MHTVEEIEKIIEEVKPGCQLTPEKELIKSGVLDSVDVMSLAMAIAEELDVEITPLELKEENFRSVEAILALVNRLEEEN
ncbi:MAG: acyl carrier protein [Faecalibacterium sp.]|jgi:acyl carrier protein|nr:acyl carrier protein [Faecalibacterium sp.]